jgi:hypothetical protein
VSVHFIVFAIRSQEVTRLEWSGVGKIALKALDFNNRLLGVHAFH